MNRVMAYMSTETKKNGRDVRSRPFELFGMIAMQSIVVDTETKLEFLELFAISVIRGMKVLGF